MKKAAGFIVLLIFMTGLIGCSGKTVKLDLSFTADDVESAVMYHFEGVPITARRKSLQTKTISKRCMSGWKVCRSKIRR